MRPDELVSVPQAENALAECPFCDYSGPSEVLLEREGVFFIEPMTPVTPGHVLAIPREHVEDALADPETTGVVMEAAAWFAHGDCNLITSVGAAATQTVRHLHVHIVPRREGDGLALPWDAALAALRNPAPEPAGSPGSPTLREALERAQASFSLIRRTIRNSRAAPNVFESLADFAKWGEEDAARCPRCCCWWGQRRRTGAGFGIGQSPPWST